MPAPVNVHTSVVTTGQAVTTTSETVVATLAGLNVDRIQRRVGFGGLVNILVGTGGTSVTVRVRRGSVSGAVVGVAQGQAVAAGSTYSIAVDALDEPGEVAGATYVLTVAVAAATANSTVNYAHLAAVVY
jgi:hypothetical protein